MRGAGEPPVRKLTRIVVFIVCLPLVGSILIKPDKRMWKQEEEDTSVIDDSFKIAVAEDVGVFYYRPESLTGLMMYRVIPADAIFSGSEDYIVRMDEVWDPEQEYLKALSIVCRSNIVYAWEAEQHPDVLEFGRMQFGEVGFHDIIQADAANEVLSDDSRSIRLNEIERAIDATQGAVLTRDGKVITAPFFITTASDMLVSEPGGGVGFSLNYAYELAVEGMNFYEILKYFYDDFRVTIYE